MSKIKIITDSGADLTQEDINKYDIEVISFSIFIDGTEYRTGVNISREEFFEKQKTCKTVPTTSQVAPAVMYEVFKKYVQQGMEILMITISSKGSGTYNTAHIAKKMILDEYPNAKIEILDSMYYAYVYGYAAIEASKMAEQGASIEEIYDMADKLIKSFDIFVIAESLKYLEKGGRINKAALVFGNLLDIRPVLAVRNGVMDAVDKIKGSKKIVKKLFDKLKEANIEKGGVMIIVYGESDEHAKELLKLIDEEFQPREIYMSRIGPTIATHIGSVLGCFFQK